MDHQLEVRSPHVRSEESEAKTSGASLDQEKLNQVLDIMQSLGLFMALTDEQKTVLSGLSNNKPQPDK